MQDVVDSFNLVVKKVGKFVLFTVLSNKPLNREQAKRIQTKEGYPADVHGLGCLMHAQDGSSYINKWRCYASKE